MNSFNRWIYYINPVLFMGCLVYYLVDRNVISSSRIQFKEIENWTLQRKNVSGNPIPYIKTNGIETYLLSAVATQSPAQTQKIVFNTLDFTKGRGDFLCCLLSGISLLTVPANFHSIYHHFEFLPFATEVFYPAPFDATQYSCGVPKANSVTMATLTLSGSCSHKKEDYLPVVYPKRVSNGLAVCAKVVCGDNLNASTIIEWMEMQKILGVDKIVLFDYKCPSSIQTVFQYYINQGTLELVPFSLPGNPERDYRLENRVYPQFYHDEEITIMDCHERLSGYQYILVSNIGDILLPRKHPTIKELLKSLIQSNPKAGGFYFPVQYHVENWGKKNEVTDSYFQQYLKSTEPTSQFSKYIYIPNRSHSLKDHSFKTIAPYKEHYVEPSIATVHHYGNCPRDWKHCVPGKIVDKTVPRYQEMLLKNKRTVLDKLNIRS